MSVIIFNIANFHAQFPAFSNATDFPDAMLQGYFDIATLYINDRYRACYGGLTLPQQTQCLYLMTAHLTAISQLIAQGQVVGVMNAATVDKVSVTMEPPKVANQWQYWLQSTPYGQQLLALLQVAGAGGFYIGGRSVLNNFRF